MKIYTRDELGEIRTLHHKWRMGIKGGKRAVLIGADLRNAVLRYAVLIGADLRNAVLRYADLSGADLRNANLRYANLSGADLRGADLSGADLRGANLSGAKGLPEIPIVPDLDKRILDAIEGGEYKLDMGDWHTCETTHCRAGFAVHFAGEKGYELESRFGAACAGGLIYHASCGYVPDFYASDEVALDDIRKRAGRA